MRFAILAFSIPLVCAAAEIPRGSHALMKLVNSVSTRTARQGDYVYLRTASPIVAGEKILVPVNSYAQGVVTQSRRSGRVTGRAELSIRIETITLPSGKVIRVSPRLESVDDEGTTQKVVSGENEIKQGGSQGQDARRIATTSGAGAAIGGLADRSWKGAGIGAGIGGAVGLTTVLVTRGREVELRRGSTIDVVFDRSVPVE
jgi:type IV secretion system protein VirB10